MSGKGPYECYSCKNNGFPGEMVFLAGRDEKGRAIRQQEDGSAHIHKSKVPSQQQQITQQQQETIATASLKDLHKVQDSIAVNVSTFVTKLDLISIKLDHVINLLEGKEQQQKGEQA